MKESQTNATRFYSPSSTFDASSGSKILESPVKCTQAQVYDLPKQLDTEFNRSSIDVQPEEERDQQPQQDLESATAQEAVGSTSIQFINEKSSNLNPADAVNNVDQAIINPAVNNVDQAIINPAQIISGSDLSVREANTDQDSNIVENVAALDNIGLITDSISAANSLFNIDNGALFDPNFNQATSKDSDSTSKLISNSLSNDLSIDHDHCQATSVRMYEPNDNYIDDHAMLSRMSSLLESDTNLLDKMSVLLEQSKINNDFSTLIGNVDSPTGSSTLNNQGGIVDKSSDKNNSDVLIESQGSLSLPSVSALGGGLIPEDQVNVSSEKVPKGSLKSRSDINSTVIDRLKESFTRDKSGSDIVNETLVASGNKQSVLDCVVSLSSEEQGHNLKALSGRPKRVVAREIDLNVNNLIRKQFKK